MMDTTSNTQDISIAQERKCDNASCDETYIPKNPSQRFHSDKCRVASWKKQDRAQKLSGSPQAPINGRGSASHHVIATALPKTQLDPVGQYIHDHQKMVIDELKEKLKKSEDLNEKKDSKIADLTKAKEEAERQVSAKPTGLQGIISNPNFLEQATALLTVAPNALGEIIKNFAQLKGPASNPLMEWISKMPEALQINFAAFCQELSKRDPDSINTFLQEASRALMAPVVEQPQQKKKAAGGMGCGINR